MEGGREGGSEEETREVSAGVGGRQCLYSIFATHILQWNNQDTSGTEQSADVSGAFLVQELKKFSGGGGGGEQLSLLERSPHF